MRRIAKAALFLLCAGLAASLAFLIKMNHLQAGLVSAGKTELNLNVSVRGTGGRVVKNARISLFDPDQIIIGKTDANGLLTGKVLVSSGRSLILQADGVAFRMQRDLLIPRSLNYSASVFFDLAEVHEGNATLISSANSESVRLERVTPTPLPETLKVILGNVGLPEQEKNRISQQLNNAAYRFPEAKNATLTCRSLNTVPVLNECELNRQGGESKFRLSETLPTSDVASEDFLAETLQFQHIPSDSPAKMNELIFLIRGGGPKFRAYLGSEPLSFWKVKYEADIYRIRFDPKTIEKQNYDLTIISENGSVFQRKFVKKPNKRMYTFRVPNVSKIDFSKRTDGPSIAR